MGFATPFGPGVLYVVFGFVDASYRFWLEALAASELQDLPKLVLVGFLLEDDPLNQLDPPDEELGVDVLLPDEYDRPLEEGLLEEDLLEDEYDRPLEEDLLEEDLLPPAYAITSIECVMNTLQIRNVETNRFSIRNSP
jgi:hypothetical protein